MRDSAGQTRVWLLGQKGRRPGASSTRNFSASPSGDDVCLSSLHEVLETGIVHPRYFLSAKACSGILRRAAKRGKELPGQLQAALQAAADTATTPTPPTA
jgi:hypothetical protein